ncbi:MAG: phosphatase PAP2 family protein [Dokdonella sp.]
MNRRLLAWVAFLFASLAAIGLLGVDRPLAEWVRSSGIEQSPLFAWGLAGFDFISGISLWFWLAGCCALAIGAVRFALQRGARWPRAFLAAGVVQMTTLETMILGKDHFGRLRPQQVLESGDWSKVWFVGGGSFPSGHSAFYFGLLLPLAAACPIRWLRNLLLAIPAYVILARIDLAKHFLSDVSTSAVIAALYALLVATLARRWLTPPEYAAR